MSDTSTSSEGTPAKKIVLNRAFPEKDPFVTVTHDHGRSLLTVVTRDLKGVGKKEFRHCLKTVGDYIRDKLSNDQSTIMVIDMREVTNFNIVKHMGEVSKFKKTYKDHTLASLDYTLMISPSCLVTIACKTLRALGKNERPVHIVEHNPREEEISNVPWENDDDIHPPLVDPTTFAK